MKVISLIQPFASLVVETEIFTMKAFKEYETRSWRTYHTGPLAIHASKGFPRWCQNLLQEGTPFSEVLNRPPEDLSRGAIIGVVYLESCRRTELVLHDEDISEREQAFGDWSFARFAWKFTNARQLPEPILIKGARGLWTIHEGGLNSFLEQLAAHHA